ncbi:hypothetical protein AVEN_229652-1 [Araneus ventricosus]|uniref:Uncharacterized protein n=1 Tax=Araneus ventricosus TaxID=182803 RepID=A0A4Y2UKR3_ARAVE|nr:hypothetical protein AVEN_229652-1 [Araneus ventricosus]
MRCSSKKILSQLVLMSQREVIKKVQDYLHSQDELSFTFSDPSSLHEEQDLGVDSQNWRNEVMAVTSSQESEIGDQNVVENNDEPVKQT